MSPNVPSKVSPNVSKTPDLGTFGDKFDFGDILRFSGRNGVSRCSKRMMIDNPGAWGQKLRVRFSTIFIFVPKCPQTGFGDIWGHLGTSRPVARFGDIWGHHRLENPKEGHLSFPTHPGPPDNSSATQRTVRKDAARCSAERSSPGAPRRHPVNLGVGAV